MSIGAQVGQVRLDLQLDGLVGGVVESGLCGGEERAVVCGQEGGGFVEEGVDVVDVVDPGVDAVEDLVGGGVALLDAGLGELGVGCVCGWCGCGEGSQGGEAGEESHVMHFAVVCG